MARKKSVKKIIIGGDHGGYRLKKILDEMLEKEEYRLRDVGTFSEEPCDYPLIGARVARAVSAGIFPRGILLCKSGAGMAIVANKFPHVRAAVCQTVELARRSRQHNDANVLVLGAEQMNQKKAVAVVKAWLETPFEAGRHARRLRQIERIERKIVCGDDV